MIKTYDRLAAGDRLRLKRTLLGMTQEDMAEKIGRATKYYADIERGNCGMSIETLLALSAAMNMSLDYIIFGEIDSSKEIIHTDEVSAIMNLLDISSEHKRRYAIQMLKIFLIACGASDEISKEEMPE